MIEAPHFSLPFRFSTPLAAVSEQNSIDEIADCVLAIMLCPLGFRVELPDFGLPDPAFASPAPDLGAIRTVVELWEPRAALVLDSQPDLLDELVAHIRTIVRVRTEA